MIALDDAAPCGFLLRSITAILLLTRWLSLFVRHSGNKELWRAAVVCVALPQMVSTAALTHADALLDGERMGTPDHVESPDNSDCPVHHDHIFCQVVRSLAHASISRGIATEQGSVPPIRVVEADCESGEARGAPTLFGSAIPRGPPNA